MNNLNRTAFYIEYEEGSNAISFSSSRKSTVDKTARLLSALGHVSLCSSPLSVSLSAPPWTWQVEVLQYHWLHSGN